MQRQENLKHLLLPAVTGLGYELWGVELLQQGRRKVLRLYIDSDEGITVDDCAAVSHQVSGVLDVEDPIKGEYNLEVSSPGMDRPFFELLQFSRFVGDQVKLKLNQAILDRRTLVGAIAGVDEVQQCLLLDVDGERLQIAETAIDRATLVPDFG